MPEEQDTTSNTYQYNLGDILLFNTNNLPDNQETCLNVKTQEGNIVKVQTQVYKNTRFIVLSDCDGLVLSEDQLEEVISKVKPQTNQILVKYPTTGENSLR